MVKIIKLFLDSLQMYFEDITTKIHQQYNFYLQHLNFFLIGQNCDFY